MKIDVASGQIQGKRDYQQDAFNQRDILPFQHKMLFLADGMGGYKGGEKASELVINSFMGKVPLVQNIKELLSHFLHQSNKSIATYKKSHPDFSSMGTTLVAMYIKDDSCQWISVGDSPLYRIRDNNIKRINENHSIAGLLDLQVRNREISQKEANSNPNRHMLTSALTGEELSMVDISNPIGIKHNDIFILASDGIETLGEEEILMLVNNANGNMESAVSDMLNEIESKNKHNQDNATLMIVSILKDNSIQSTFTLQEEEYSNQKSIDSGTKKNKIFPIIITLLLVLAILIGVLIGMPSPVPVLKVEDNQTKNFKELHEKLIDKIDTNSSYVQKIHDINISECLERNTTCVPDKTKELKKLEKNIDNWADRENNLTKLSLGIVDDNITKQLKDMNITLMQVDDGNFSNFDINMTSLEKKIIINKKDILRTRLKYIKKDKKCKRNLNKRPTEDDNTLLYKEILSDMEKDLGDSNTTLIQLEELKTKLDNLVQDTNCSDKKKE